MMALTHGFMSLAVAVLALPAVPDAVAAPLLAAAFVGGLAPDADLLARHRRTLHFPVLSPLLTLALFGGFLATSSLSLLVAAAGVGGAALHSLADVLGGSAERAPWDPVTERGVYNHALGAWHRPRRYVRYSGAPEDFLLGAAFAAVAALSPATSSAADLGIVALVVFAGGYTLARKRLGALPALLGAVVPAGVRSAVPRVRVEELDDGGTTIAVRRDR